MSESTENKRELFEDCAECGGESFHDGEGCPECLGIGRVFIGYVAEEVAPRVHRLVMPGGAVIAHR